MSDNDFIKSVDDLRDLFSAISDQVPGLLRGLRNVLYSKEAAENMADAVSTFYTKLVEAGIPKEEAMDMARGYVLNLRELLGSKAINIGGIVKADRRGDRD